MFKSGYEMKRESHMHGGDEKYVQNFGRHRHRWEQSFPISVPWRAILPQISLGALQEFQDMWYQYGQQTCNLV
jgi:hypothetical protein